MRAFFHVPELTGRQWKVLLLISSATFFDYYDITLISLALKQIQSDLLIEEQNIGLIGAVVQFGKIPAIFVVLAADRFGRRPVLLVTIVAYTVFTGMSGLAPEAMSFVLLQFLARTFATAEVILAHVVVTEEIDANLRGWAVGVMGTLAALGSGMAYVLFGFIDYLPGGWRALYLIGLAPLFLIIFLRRNLPETERFADMAARENPAPGTDRTDAPGSVHLLPLLKLVRMYPGRFLAIGLVTFFYFSMQEVGYFLTPKYLQETHDWKPYYISLFAPFGLITIFMNMAGGWMGDRFGRKRVTFLFIVLTGAAALALFTGDGFVFLGAAMVSVGAFTAGARTNLFVYTAELFPTSYRSTAGGGLMVLNALGGMAGLALESMLFRLTGSHPASLAIMVALLLPALAALLFLPDTSRRTLEEIAPERDFRA